MIELLSKFGRSAKAPKHLKKSCGRTCRSRLTQFMHSERHWRKTQSTYWCQYTEWQGWTRYPTLCYRETHLHTIFPGNVPSLSGPRFAGKIAHSMKASAEAWRALSPGGTSPCLPGSPT